VPTRYLPVGQGFIVEIVADGQVEFNNGQRVFVKEADADGSFDNGSAFSKSANGKSSKSGTKEGDKGTMQKMRLELTSISGPKADRELLLGFSDYTTDGFDYGYDAKCTESNNNDLNLSLEGANYNIQAYGEIVPDKVVPLNFKSSGNNSFEIKLTGMEHIEEDQNIYLKDNLTGACHDLRESPYSFTSAQGKFNERFEIVFQNEAQTLGTEDLLAGDNHMYYKNPSRTFYAKHLTTDIKHLTLVNMRGQKVLEIDKVSRARLESGIQFDNIATGAYVVCLTTDSNTVRTKKILVN